MDDTPMINTPCCDVTMELAEWEEAVADTENCPKCGTSHPEWTLSNLPQSAKLDAEKAAEKLIEAIEKAKAKEAYGPTEAFKEFAKKFGVEVTLGSDTVPDYAEADAKATKHMFLSGQGTCPGCGEDKFVGPGPLCLECLEGGAKHTVVIEQNPVTALRKKALKALSGKGGLTEQEKLWNLQVAYAALGEAIALQKEKLK